MTEYATLLFSVDGPVCTITLNRPEKYNAINQEMASELLRAFRCIRDLAEVRVVVLTGSGKAFCTGGDLSIFPSLMDHKAGMNWLAHEGYDIGKAVELCEKVVIAKVKGYCLAGGLELALMCDLIYAAESALFGATEINMGILPGWGGTVRLPRAMPLYRAREMVYSGRKDYRASELYEMGFLTRVFKDDEFEERFAEVVRQIAAKKGNALRMAKEVMNRSLECGSMDAALTLERNAIQWLNHAPDLLRAREELLKNPELLLASQKQSETASEPKR